MMILFVEMIELGLDLFILLLGIRVVGVENVE